MRKSAYRQHLDSLAGDPRAKLYRSKEWLKLSNAVLKAFPSSPRQKELKQKLSELERKILGARQSNPMKTHTASWDRCVKSVKRQGAAANPYAVCTAALKEMAFRKKRRR